MNRKRIAIVTARPVHYYAPLYRKLAAVPGLDVTVVYGTAVGVSHAADPSKNFSYAKSDPGQLEGYRFVFLPGADRVRKLSGLLASLNPAIVRHLLTERYDAIWIHGYHVGTNLLAALVQRFLLRREVLLRDDQHLRNPRSKRKQRFKRAVLPLLFRRIKGLYVGTLNREWLHYFGIPDDQLYFVPHTVDNDRIQEIRNGLEPRRAELRRSFGIADAAGPVILAAGRLIWEKDHPTLLAAFRQLRERQQCVLLFAGDGPEREAIETRVREEGIPDVVLAGAVDQGRMMEAYAAADIFVLASKSETWGIVVNEAMNFALPVVTSSRVGCSVDLVQDGVNGYTFPVGDAGQLARHLGTLAASRETRQQFGAASLSTINQWTYDAAVKGALQALDFPGATANGQAPVREPAL